MLKLWEEIDVYRKIRAASAGRPSYMPHDGPPYDYGALYSFCTIDLSSFYLDVLKDRFYAAGGHSPERRSAQTGLWKVLDALTRLVGPVIPFTAEEVYGACV